MSNELSFDTLKTTSERLARREVSPLEVLESYLGRIDRLNDRLHTFITVCSNEARSEAAVATDEIQRGVSRGPLHGIPYAPKDIFATQGIKTTAGSRVLEDWVPDHDADVVERLKKAGSVLIGKTNLHEFCHGITGENPHFGTARNPWDTSRLAGGSSSGSAAAVAARMVPLALGSDVGGSVRVPAALCGIVGLKPTLGRISCRGAIPYCWSLDHVGLFTNSVVDAAMALEALAGYDPMDAASVDEPVPPYSKQLLKSLKGTRIGVPRRFYFEHIDSEIDASVRESIAFLQSQGAIIQEIDLPELGLARTVSLLVQLPEVFSHQLRYFKDRAHLYGGDLREGFAAGQFILAEHYIRAKRQVEVYRRDTVEVFRKVDAIITPTCPIVAPKVGVVEVSVGGREELVGTALTRYAGFFNLTGHPAISIPCGLHSSGLPMAIQIVGRHFEEGTVLNIADNLERNIDWRSWPMPGEVRSGRLN